MSSFDDPLSGVNDDTERSSFFRYGASLRQINLGIFFMVAARSIVLTIFIPAATSLIIVIHTLGSSATSTRLFCYIFLAYWCGYSCR
jgi:hypothetical protein